jgi:hypothetical protein
MMQVGILMALIGLLLGVMTFLGLRGTDWDYLLYMLALVGIFYIRTPSEIARLRLHWKIVVLYAAVSSFIMLFFIIQRVTGLDFNLSLAASFLIGSFVLLFLDRLDGKSQTPTDE